MKRDFLEGLGIETEVIEKIMKENGKDIESLKAKFADYDDVQKQLEKANATLEKFKDYDAVKADVAKYQQEAENAKKEAAAKVQQLELQAKIKDFTGNKKFVNDLTRDAINAQLEATLNDDNNKGKSLDDLLKALTDGKTDIFKEENDPTAPVVTGMQGNKGDENGVMAAFKRMNPDLKID
jgi:hypothetical protein